MAVLIGILIGVWYGGLVIVNCLPEYNNAPKSSYTIFRSSTRRYGEFQSENWPGNYPQNIRHLFIFMGTEYEQVQVHFHLFNVEGLSTICKKDFLDIYIDLALPINPLNISDALIKSPLLGRYCGHNLDFIPNTLVSKQNVLVLDFFSDVNTQKSYNQDNHMGKLGFRGNFTFRRNRMKVQFLSKPSSYSSSCFYTISATKTSHGIIQSPTFPGLPSYPLSCVYKFESSNLNDRVQLIFTDFMLFQMFDSCPLEHIRIFSRYYRAGSLTDVPILLETCGSKVKFHVTSASNILFLVFQVNSDHTFLKQRHNMKPYKRSLLSRGFRAEFRFYEDKFRRSSLLQEDFIPGTECDKAIRSVPDNTGQVTVKERFLKRTRNRKPVLCNFYFMGLHNSQMMEVVLLNFTFVNLPTTSYHKCTGASISLKSSTFKILDIVKRERRIMLNNQSNTPELCGIKRNYQYKAISPVTVLQVKIHKFISNNLIPTGFQVKYQFIRDFGITGTMLTPGKCHFVYQSQDKSTDTQNMGLINSPFYNNFYPNNAHCQYDLIAKSDEIIRIVFIDFQTSEDISPGLMNQHDVHMACRQDYLSISEIVRHSNQEIVMNVTERYCGDSLPGLLVSQRDSMGFTLIFKSNHNKSGPGFLAEYQFLKKTPMFMNSCGKNVSLLENHGIISSPHYPKRYPANLICEWHLYSPFPNDRIILLFSHFKIEGNAKSCSSAVLRIYEASNVKARLELCGIDPKITAYVSTHNFIRIRFLTDKRSTGADGFQILWTRSIGRLDNGSCADNGFLCQYSGHCIHRNLTCNNEFNCGSFVNISGSVIFDKSDETIACPQKPDLSHLYFGLVIVAGIFLVLFVIILIFHRKNRRLLAKKHLFSSTISDKDTVNMHPLKLDSIDPKEALLEEQRVLPQNFIYRNNKVMSDPGDPPRLSSPNPSHSCYFYYSSTPTPYQNQNSHNHQHQSVIQNTHLNGEDPDELPSCMYQSNNTFSCSPDPFDVLDQLPPTYLSDQYSNDESYVSPGREHLQKISMV